MAGTIPTDGKSWLAPSLPMESHASHHPYRWKVMAGALPTDGESWLAPSLPMESHGMENGDTHEKCPPNGDLPGDQGGQ